MLSHASCFLVCSVWFSCWNTRPTSTRPARVGGMLSTLLAGVQYLCCIVNRTCTLLSTYASAQILISPNFCSSSTINLSVCIELHACVPIHRHGQLKCVRLLLERGARMVPDNDGVSPLELCAQVTNPSIVWRRGPTLES